MKLMATYGTMDNTKEMVWWIKKDTPERRKFSVMLKEQFHNHFNRETSNWKFKAPYYDTWAVGGFDLLYQTQTI